jgi:superfamily I DNA/RNA helicase
LASTAIEGVQLMTVYQAKGLEYQVVVVPRLLEGQFPDTRPENQLIPVELLKQKPPPQFEVDEERRLCFVAMTRAKQRLIMTTVSAREGSKDRPSRFVEEVIGGAEDVGLSADVEVVRREPTVDAEVRGPRRRPIRRQPRRPRYSNG